MVGYLASGYQKMVTNQHKLALQILSNQQYLKAQVGQPMDRELLVINLLLLQNPLQFVVPAIKGRPDLSVPKENLGQMGRMDLMERMELVEKMHRSCQLLWSLLVLYARQDLLVLKALLVPKDHLALKDRLESRQKTEFLVNKEWLDNTVHPDDPDEKDLEERLALLVVSFPCLDLKVQPDLRALLDHQEPPELPDLLVNRLKVLLDLLASLDVLDVKAVLADLDLLDLLAKMEKRAVVNTVQNRVLLPDISRRQVQKVVDIINYYCDIKLLLLLFILFNQKKKEPVRKF